MGYHPVPGHFIDMIILHLGVTEETARALLLWMGILDFAVAAAMALPSRLARPFLAYAALWGALTALARFGAWFDPTGAAFGATMWVPEILIRAPHALLPLALLALDRGTRAASGPVGEPSSHGTSLPWAAWRRPARYPAAGGDIRSGE